MYKHIKCAILDNRYTYILISFRNCIAKISYAVNLQEVDNANPDISLLCLVEMCGATRHGGIVSRQLTILAHNAQLGQDP